MVRTVYVLCAAVVASALLLPAPPADAQTASNPTLHARAKHKPAKPKPEGRQITVHKATPSYLTLGGFASPAVTSPNNYVIDTFSQPTPIEGTFTGMRGRERLLGDRFDGPGIPLFRF
jgi:hypothetical protein